MPTLNCLVPVEGNRLALNERCYHVCQTSGNYYAGKNMDRYQVRFQREDPMVESKDSEFVWNNRYELKCCNGKEVFCPLLDQYRVCCFQS